MTIKEIMPEEKIWQLLQQVTDPEIPVLSIIELGIVRKVCVNDTEVEITITPTYSGCPAMDVMAMNIRIILLQNGFKKIIIASQLSPAWTTAWISEEGKNKLKAYGIAPPQTLSDGERPDRLNKILFAKELNIECPQCHSKNTEMLSQFGSTACKALYKCLACKEPFDYFKCH